MVHQLMSTHDIGCWSETHGNTGRGNMWRNPPGCLSWWSPGPSAATAGVGITIRSEFLRRFDECRPEVLFPGRALRLRLSGAQGSLDIISVYFPTGDSTHEDDIREAGFEVGGRTVSNFELREALCRRLALRIRPRDQGVTVIAGDFNFVVNPLDRLCTSSCKNTGGRDHRDLARWRDLVETPFGFHELFQPEPTYASPDSRSRLDRVYSNQWDTEFMDKAFSSTALRWTPHLSRHRPLSMRKSLPASTQNGNRPISEQVLAHPDWAFQVGQAYHSLLTDHPDASAIRKLQLFKGAMRIAEKLLSKRVGETPPAENLEDRLGTAMRFLRASEQGIPERVSSCLERYPLLSELVRNPYDFSGVAGPRLARVRRHIMDLQRDFTMQELNSLHEDLRDLDPLQAARRRKRNRQLVCRLAPGRSCQQFAVDTPAGTATTDPNEMLHLLREHWRQVFCQREVDVELMDRWLREDVEHLPEDFSSHLPHSPVPAETFLEAIRCTKNSAPGRDGIPFKAWRLISELAAEVFHKAYSEMTSPEGPDKMREEWANFNECLMVFLPKKPTATLPGGLETFSPGCFRPLAIANTDNRILGSAVRLHIEPTVAPCISPEQRGFVRGRSMLANVLDVEEAMLEAGLVHDDPAAIFLDFEAAFPSLNQKFIQRVLAARGWPPWMLRFVEVLYTNNLCVLSLGGNTGPGFQATAGVRQGCPLSPLLFAIVSDVLLRRVRRLAPAVLIRAYADDIALVLRSLRDARMLEVIFGEYEFISRLRLHPSKSVVVPLYLGGHDEVRASLMHVARAWGAFKIAGHAKYLGFVLGPTRGEQAWSDAVRKMHERARVWKGIGGGMCVTLSALRVYVLPLASFLLQLEPLPQNWPSEEMKLVNTLFPGARGWTAPVLMRSLREIGFSNAMPDMRSMAVGAKYRVHRWEDARHGGLRVRRRLRSITATRTGSIYIVRTAHWRSWFEDNFFAQLQRAQQELADMAGARNLTIEALMQGTSTSPTPREHWQKRSSQLLRQPDPAGIEIHLRRRLDRWEMQLPQGRRVDRARTSLRRLGPLVPPCVWAAVLKAIMDGWTMMHPDRRRTHCCFGCQMGQDTIQHYARCTRVADMAHRRLRLAPAPGTDRLLDFLVMDGGDDTHLACSALRLYATFIAANAYRNGRAEGARDAWLQAMTEAAGRNYPVSQIVAARWNNLPTQV